MSEEETIEKQPEDDRPPVADDSEISAEDPSISLEKIKLVLKKKLNLEPKPSNLNLTNGSTDNSREKQKNKIGSCEENYSAT